jgi:hypothetical protein
MDAYDTMHGPGTVQTGACGPPYECDAFHEPGSAYPRNTSQIGTSSTCCLKISFVYIYHLQISEITI